jgi:hypothetical protein
MGGVRVNGDGFLAVKLLGGDGDEMARGIYVVRQMWMGKGILWGVMGNW